MTAPAHSAQAQGDELAACPFCGASMATYTWREQAGTVVVECRFCGVRTNSGETETEVAELWNRRTRLSEWKGRAEALEQRVVELTAERDDLQATFDMRWSAQQRAIKRWQDAHPGSDLVWPDHADLIVWSLGELEAAHTLIEELKIARDREKSFYATERDASAAARASLAAAEAQMRAKDEVLAATVAAWEALPGDRHYSPKVVEAWMINHMAPAINSIRAALAAVRHRPLRRETSDGQ